MFFSSCSTSVNLLRLRCLLQLLLLVYRSVLIHRINDGPKPCFSSVFRTNVQFRWSEAFSASSERLVVMVTVVRQMYEAEKSTCII